MEAHDRVNQPAPEGVTGQLLLGALDRNREVRTSEIEPETTAPRWGDYCLLTGRGVPSLPCIRPSAEPAQRDYSALTGRT
jgi:hypothetical protein